MVEVTKSGLAEQAWLHAHYLAATASRASATLFVACVNYSAGLLDPTVTEFRAEARLHADALLESVRDAAVAVAKAMRDDGVVGAIDVDKDRQEMLVLMDATEEGGEEWHRAIEASIASLLDARHTGRHECVAVAAEVVALWRPATFEHVAANVLLLSVVTQDVATTYGRLAQDHSRGERDLMRRPMGDGLPRGDGLLAKTERDTQTNEAATEAAPTLASLRARMPQGYREQLESFTALVLQELKLCVPDIDQLVREGKAEEVRARFNLAQQYLGNEDLQDARATLREVVLSKCELSDQDIRELVGVDAHEKVRERFRDARRYLRAEDLTEPFQCYQGAIGAVGDGEWGAQEKKVIAVRLNDLAKAAGAALRHAGASGYLHPAGGGSMSFQLKSEVGGTKPKLGLRQHLPQFELAGTQEK